MKVTHIKINNVAGLREYELSPGQITEIRGKNGQGKSSILRALDNVFGGGNLAEIRNLDTDEKPEIVVYLDDGKIQIRKTQKGVTVKKQVGETAALEAVKAPQRFLNGLIDGKLINPISLLRAKPKDRVDTMLESITLDYDRDTFAAEVGFKPTDYDPIPDGVHPLIEIGMYREQVYKRRTAYNVEHRKAADTADKMLRSVPLETPESPDVAGLREKRDRLIDTKKTKTHEAEDAEKQELNRIKMKQKIKSEEITHAANMAIEKIKNQMQNDLSALSAETLTEIDRAEREKDAALQSIPIIDAEISAIEKELDDADRQAEERTRILSLKEVARDMEQDAILSKDRADSMTAVLSEIDDYKTRLCNSLPIPGLSVVDGEICIDRIPWDQVNTARQIEIAVLIAAIRAQKQQLKIIWVDDAEHLDPASLQVLKNEIQKHGLQPFIASVADCDLVAEVG